MYRISKLFARQGTRRRPLSAFARNSDGIAAVEFAMILPIMFFLFVGAVEFSQAITVDRRVTQVASSSADLVAQAKDLSASEMTNIFSMVDRLVWPYDKTRMKISIVNVRSPTGAPTPYKVQWSCAHNGGALYSANTNYALPTGLIEEGTSIIVAEVKYNYTPLIFSYFIESAFDLEERFYLRPRQGVVNLTSSCS